MAAHLRRTLQSVKEVVRTLGGTSAAAALLGIGPSAITNWIASGCIPPARYIDLDRALSPRGFEIDPSLFKHRRPRGEENAA